MRTSAARSTRQRGPTRQRQLAEDARLLPKGLLDRLTEAAHDDQDTCSARASLTCSGRCRPTVACSVAEQIQWFNGALFDGSDVLPLANGLPDTPPGKSLQV